MHFILLKYIHNIMRYMCFYKNRLNLPRSPLHSIYTDFSKVRKIFAKSSQNLWYIDIN